MAKTLTAILLGFFTVTCGWCGGINSRDPRLLFYSHFDEGTGVSAKDETNISTGANLINGVAWVSGKKTFGVNLDGTNDRIVISTPNNIISLTTGTIGFWFKNPSSSGARVIITKTKDSLNNNRFFIYQGIIFGGESDVAKINFTPNEVNFFRDIGQDFVGSGSKSFDDGKWHHLFFDFKSGVGGLMKVVIDGGSGASTLGYSTAMAQTAAVQGDSIIMIGETVNQAGFNWGGTIDEFAIWNEIISDGEKKRIYLDGIKSRKDR